MLLGFYIAASVYAVVMICGILVAAWFRLPLFGMPPPRPLPPPKADFQRQQR